MSANKKKLDKKVIIAIALVLIAVIAVIASGVFNKSKTDDTKNPADAQAVFTTLYGSEVSTLNYLTTGTTWDQTIGANVIDTLVEYNSFAQVIPGLAESWEVSEDELTWTFHLRKGVKWYDHTGKPVADVTANDFVSALKYVLTAEYDSSSSYLVYDAANIVNAVEYEAGEITDFSLVGVKAVDDYTLQYNVTKPTPYFVSCMTYGCFMPAYGPQLEELGADFATDNEKMYYCGAFIMEEFEPQVKHVFVKNYNNLDAANVHLDKIVREYNAEAATLGPVMVERGEIDSASLSNDILDEWMSKNPSIVVRDRAVPDYSYFYAFNFNPQYDAEYEPENWILAVNNENFRQSIMKAFDRLYAMRAIEPNNPESVLQNTITPKTFAAVNGTDFSELEPFAGVADLYFNAEAALEYKTKAVEELTAAGAKFPVKMVITYKSGDTDWENESILLKQQIEGVLGTDYVECVLWAGPSESFLSKTRRAGMYSFMRVNWGGDYVDPATWTDPFAESFNAADALGNLYAADGAHKGNSYNMMDMLLDTDAYPETTATVTEYYAAVTEAKAITTDTLQRYTKLAAAERILLDNAIVVPYCIWPASAQVTKLNIFEGQYAPFGMSNLRYKYQHLSENYITVDQFNAAEAAWLEAMGTTK